MYSFCCFPHLLLKVKSVLKPIGPPSCSLSWFPCSEATRSITTPPLDAMLDHCKVTPQHFIRFPWQFAGSHLYSWVKRSIVGVKCSALEQNTLSRHRSRTQTSRPWECVFHSSLIISNINCLFSIFQGFFIQCGVYLILEKLKIITYRNLFKKV